MSFLSTIPAAVTTVGTYMNTVAAATTVPGTTVYHAYSESQNLEYNYLMIGEYQTGTIVAPTEGSWASMGVQAKRRQEHYVILGHIRTWAGGNDWQSRFNDAFTLLDSLTDQILADPGGSGSFPLGGSWGKFNWKMEENGPLGGASGWGVVFGFELEVINAQVQGL